VAYILEGTTRPEEQNPRFTELIQVRDQTQLWGETYERGWPGFKAFKDIARGWPVRCRLLLRPGSGWPAYDRQSRSLRGFSQSVHYRETMTTEGFDAAERYLNLALEKDPNYATAWAEIGSVWISRQQMWIVPSKEAFLKAKAALDKALELDDKEPEANRVLAGYLSWAEWDWEAADRQWKRVFELNPNYVPALPGYAHFLMNTGRPKEAMAKIELALELDPFNVRIQSFYAMVLLFVRRYDDAIAAARKAMDFQADQPLARNALINTLFMKSSYDEIMALERERWANDLQVLEALERGFAEAGFAGARMRQCEVLTERYGKPGGVAAYTMAILCIQAGDTDSAVEWLEKAYEARDGNMPYLGMPYFDLLRSDPRFQDLVRRVGLLKTRRLSPDTDPSASLGLL
jgi:Tfp pilus assembly protein PilF